MSDSEEPKPAPQPEKLSPNSVLDSIFRDEGPMPPAKLGIRLLAFLMDAVLIAGVSALILKLTLLANFPNALELFNEYAKASEDMDYIISVIKDPELINPGLQDVFSYIFLVITMTSWFYFAFGESFFKGHTLGKRSCRLRTMSAINLAAPSIFNGLIRGGIKTAGLLFFGIFGWIGILLPLFFNKRRQMAHDWLSRTVVVDEKRMQQQGEV